MRSGLGARVAGVTQQDVREALWGERRLVKTYGPRGTLHLLPAGELPMWMAALQAIPDHHGAMCTSSLAWGATRSMSSSRRLGRPWTGGGSPVRSSRGAGAACGAVGAPAAGLDVG
jgi:Winged helix DNA-binding domain